MGGQILPRGYLGITPPDVECIHGLGGMDSTMEHACATSRADKTQTGPKSKYLTLLAFQLGKMAWPLYTLVSSSNFPRNFRKGRKSWGKKPNQVADTLET